MRSGYATTAFVLAGDNQNVWQDTAIICDWVPYSRAQREYFKDAAVRSMLSDKVRDGAKKRTISNPLSLQNFHKFKSNKLKSTWKEGRYLKAHTAKRRKEESNLILGNEFVSAAPEDTKASLVSEIKNRYNLAKQSSSSLKLSSYIAKFVTETAVSRILNAKGHYERVVKSGAKRTRTIFTEAQSKALVEKVEENRMKKIKNCVQSIATLPIFNGLSATQLHNHLQSIERSKKRGEREEKILGSNRETSEDSAGSISPSECESDIDTEEYEGYKKSSDSESESESDSESESGSDSESESGSDSESDGDSQRESDSDSQRESDSESQSESEEEAKRNLNSDMDSASDYETDKYENYSESSSSESECDITEVKTTKRVGWDAKEISKFKELYKRFRSEKNYMSKVSNHPYFLGKRRVSQLQDKRKHLIGIGEWEF